MGDVCDNCPTVAEREPARRRRRHRRRRVRQLPRGHEPESARRRYRRQGRRAATTARRSRTRRKPTSMATPWVTRATTAGRSRMPGSRTPMATAWAMPASWPRVGTWTTGLTHTVGAGNDRLLVFMVGYENSTDTLISTVKYGGQSLTRANGTVGRNGRSGRAVVSQGDRDRGRDHQHVRRDLRRRDSVGAVLRRRDHQERRPDHAGVRQQHQLDRTRRRPTRCRSTSA